MSDRCKRCPARVIWCRTVTGKAMPVDAAPANDGNVIIIETAGGPQAVVVKSTADFPDLPRHKSHFATCPAATSFRKSKERSA